MSLFPDDMIVYVGKSRRVESKKKTTGTNKQSEQKSQI